MTVIVDTPEGVRSGSSVIEVESYASPAIPGPEAGGVRTRVHGEAVTVDLGSRGLLFALLNGGAGPAFYAPSALLNGRPMNTGSIEERRGKLNALLETEGHSELRPRHYPLMVRFNDIDDPSSVELVEPGDLAASFGPGVSLRAITVEITDDPVTERIEERLAWLDVYSREGRRLSGNDSIAITSNELTETLGAGVFRREL